MNITFVYELDNGTDSSTVDQIKLSVSQSTYHSNSSTTWLITVTGHNPGHVTLVLKNITDGTNTTAYEYVYVLHYVSAFVIVVLICCENVLLPTLN